MAVSRLDRVQSETPPEDATAESAPDSARIAEDIGIAVFDLVARARAAGLTTIGYLLELAALEAGVQAATRQIPVDDETPDQSA